MNIGNSNNQYAERFDCGADELVRALLSFAPERNVSILDSCGAREPDGRYLIAGFDPEEVIEFWSTDPKAGEKQPVREPGISHVGTVDEFLSALDQRIPSFSSGPSSTFPLPSYGGCVISLAYELGYELENVFEKPYRVSSTVPLARLAFYRSLVVHDYESGETYLTSVDDKENAAQKVAILNQALRDVRLSADAESEGTRENDLQILSTFNRDSYTRAVCAIKERIAEGDIYQANLTQQFVAELDESTTPGIIFQRLRKRHPASFAAFISTGYSTIISDSPERFISLNAEGVIQAWPIKGTRPRGRTQAEDDDLRELLLNSEKDRAENVMIVDLLRNDLGRICDYGSIEAWELCALQEHPTLFHLVSKIRGHLKKDISPSQIIRAIFPCGSITGAPKIRAMQILREIEQQPRGISMGAIGYCDFDGRMDLNVAIRTLAISNGKAIFNTGGGIVADSDPEAEYEESLLKAKALIAAMG